MAVQQFNFFVVGFMYYVKNVKRVAWATGKYTYMGLEHIEHLEKLNRPLVYNIRQPRDRAEQLSPEYLGQSFILPL